MPELISKPLSEMTALERDIYFGEWKDVSDERREWARNYAEDEFFIAIYNHVANMLKKGNIYHSKEQRFLLYSKTVDYDTNLSQKVRLVAKMFDLTPLTSWDIPSREYWIPFASQVEELILRRRILAPRKIEVVKG